jgi:hypothetical protein
MPNEASFPSESAGIDLRDSIRHLRRLYLASEADRVRLVNGLDLPPDLADRLQPASRGTVRAPPRSAWKDFACSGDCLFVG